MRPYRLAVPGWGRKIASMTWGPERTTSPRQVSTDPPGKYIFSFTPLRLIVAILVQNSKAILPSEGTT